MLVDFEVAQASAFFSIFEITAFGCFFHYRQCLERKLFIIEKKLLDFISSDSTGEARITFNYFSALALTSKLSQLRSIVILENLIILLIANGLILLIIMKSNGLGN